MSSAEVTQGSIVTCVRYGGKYSKALLQNPTVKKIKIGQQFYLFIYLFIIFLLLISVHCGENVFIC